MYVHSGVCLCVHGEGRERQEEREKVRVHTRMCGHECLKWLEVI